MPMIETNSPAVLEKAHQQIATMVERLREHPDDYRKRHGEVRLVTGYLGALLEHDLIDEAMFILLGDERDRAAHATVVYPS